MTDQDNVIHVMQDESDFKPGVYRHYKGGLYQALALARSHETGERHVVYISMTTGDWHARVYSSYNEDAWSDDVRVGESDADWVKRFAYVGVQPLTTPRPPAIQLEQPR